MPPPRQSEWLFKIVLLSKNDKSIIMNHLKENYYRISILSETMKSEQDLEELVKEKINTFK